MNEKAPNYLINLIPNYEPTIRTRNNSIPLYKCQTNCFKFFFPSTLNDWFNLDINIRNSDQLPYSNVGYYLLFIQFKIAYTIFSTLKD